MTCRHCRKQIAWIADYEEWMHVNGIGGGGEPLCYGTGPYNLALAAAGKALYAEPQVSETPIPPELCGVGGCVYYPITKNEGSHTHSWERQ